MHLWGFVAKVHLNKNFKNIKNQLLDLRHLIHAIFFFLFQAFMTYDVEHNLGVTKGEFRRVLESFCVPLTSEQFEAVVAKVHNSVLVDYLKCETHFNPNLLNCGFNLPYTQSLVISNTPHSQLLHINYVYIYYDQYS